MFRSLFIFGTLLLPPRAGSGTIFYHYDQLNRLTSVVYSDGPAISYAYDAAGNRLRMAIGGSGAAIIKGDVDGDLAVTLRDVLLVLQILAGKDGTDPIFLLFGWTTTSYESPRMRILATLGNPNFVSALLAAGLPVAWVLAKRPNRRALFSTAWGLQMLALLATGSRAGLLAVAASLVWLCVLGRASIRILLGLGLLLLFVAAFIPSRNLMTTIDGRLYIWRITASHVFEKPLFGFGPGSFEPKYIEWETEHWRKGRGAAEERKFASLQAHAHNDFLEILVESGFAGLFGFLSVLGSFSIFAFRKARETGDALLAGASAGVIALASTALVDFPFYRPAALFFFWTSMALTFLAALAPAADAGTGPLGMPG